MFPQSRYAYADLNKPEPWLFCDRCGFRKMHKDATFQFDWRGTKLADLRILVCPVCLDVPQEQLRTIIIGPDPIPVRYPRPGFQAQQQGYTPVFSILELVDGDLEPPLPATIGNDGGVAILLPPGVLPASDLMVPPGGFWSNGGVISIVPGFTPTPAGPVYYPGPSAVELAAVGAAGLPQVDPQTPGVFWNNGGELSISFG